MPKRLLWLIGALIPVAGLLYVRWVAVNAGLSLDMPRCAWEMVVGDSVQLPGPRGESPYGELKLFRVHFDFRDHPRLFTWIVDQDLTERGIDRPRAVAIDRSGMMRAMAPGISKIEGDWWGPWHAGRQVFEDIYVLPATLRAIELSATRDTIAINDTVRVRYVLRGSNGDSLNWPVRIGPRAGPDEPLYQIPRPGSVFEGLRPGTGTVEMCIGSRRAKVTVVVR